MSQNLTEIKDINDEIQSVKKWLLLASELDEITDENLLILKPIPPHLLNCRELIGWL